MTRFAWQPGFVVWHHVAVKLPHKRSCWWHKTHRHTARVCFSNRQPILCMKPAESYCWNLKWGFLHLPNNLTRPRLCIPAALYSLPCVGIPVQCRPGCLARACMIKLSPADQGLSSASALTSTLTTNPGILEFLRFLWATWKLLHRGQELQAKCLKVFVGRLHSTSCYKRSSSRSGLSQCWSTLLTTEDSLYIM